MGSIADGNGGGGGLVASIVVLGLLLLIVGIVIYLKKKGVRLGCIDRIDFSRLAPHAKTTTAQGTPGELEGADIATMHALTFD